MGRFTVHPITLALGWVATIIMALAAVSHQIASLRKPDQLFVPTHRRHD